MDMYCALGSNYDKENKNLEVLYIAIFSLCWHKKILCESKKRVNNVSFVM